MPVTHDLVLWLAADGIVKRDTQNNVSVWGDLCVGENGVPENAEQYDQAKQPIWVEDAIGGKPALRFDGRTTYLETEPLETTDEQTVFCVVESEPQEVRSLKRSNIDGLQILNYNGSPNIVVEWTGEAALRGRSHAPTNTNPFRSVGQATGPVHATAKPIVCAYVYSRSENRAQLYEEGQLVAEAEAPEPAAITSSKFIGAHFAGNRHFVGDLAELMIFNTASGEGEISAVSGYLMYKYGKGIGTTN